MTNIYLWFDYPPRAGAGLFRELTLIWPSNVTFIIHTGLREERIKSGWENVDYFKAKIVYLESVIDKDKYINNIILADPSAIHVFNGFKSFTSKYFKNYFVKQKYPRLAMWTERPGVYGSFTKRIIKSIYLPLYYRYIYIRYNNKIQLLMPLGYTGLKFFKRTGWSCNKMYPLMYDPPVPEIIDHSPFLKQGDIIKFLYIGRFSKHTKGIDTLMKAFTNLNVENWKLDLVGGYGIHAEEVINWSNNSQNVMFIGRWNSSDVISKMKDYDVVVVPSKFDGWNVIINEAIHAGLCIIASDESVSHELVIDGDCGVVYNARKYKELKSSLEMFVSNPDLVNKYKDNSRKYSEKVKSNEIALYLSDVLKSVYFDDLKKIDIPWKDK